jgi:hypothetical protein
MLKKKRRQNMSKADKEFSETIFNKLEEMDNKLERIKSDTHNLNRIASLSNSSIIVQELKKIIGRSEVRAAILYLTREEIGAGDLSKALGINIANLAMYLKPFLGNRGYVAEIKKGRNKYFQRSELVDLVGFESIDEFAALIKSWQEKQKKGAQPEEVVVSKEDSNGK